MDNTHTWSNQWQKDIEDLLEAKEKLDALPPDKQAIAVTSIFTLYAAYGADRPPDTQQGE